MPELPEVETIVRQLQKAIKGEIIKDIWADSPGSLSSRLSFNQFKKTIQGSTIKDIQRRGKNILIFLSKDYVLLIHLRLTGHLLVGKYIFKDKKWIPQEKGSLEERENLFIHWLFLFYSGRALALSDRRKLAKILLLSSSELEKEKSLKELGIEPLSLDFTLQKLKEIVQRSKTEIKRLLMDQKYLVGIGNIYANEILFAAKINPFRKANSLKPLEIQNLYTAIKKTLQQAISYQGTSARDETYRNIYGEKGQFARFLKVYQREGQPCVRCGTAIKRKTQGERSTYWCPHCQK